MKQAKCLLTLFLFLFAAQAKATHLAGGELRYEYNGTNYTFYLTMYSNCSGAGMGSSFKMTMKSTSLGINTQVTLPQVSVMQVTMPCPGVSTKCDTPPGNFPGYRKHIFSDTITLAAAADWVFNIDECCRNVSNNLSPNSTMYLGTTLNNLSGVNSNTLVPSLTPAYIAVNTTTTSPLQYIDPDGDSVVIVPSAALQSNGAPVAYTTGKSATQPYGTTGIYIVDAANGTITQRSPMMGTTVLAFTVYEYRNGTLISSYNREYITATLAGTGNYSYTYPLAPIQVAYACPGAAGSATASFVDSVSTDSVFVSVDTTTLPAGWNFSVNNTNGMGSGSTTINWTAPSSLNPNTFPYFFIKVKTWDDACPRGYNEYAILVKTQQCPTDSVWPGDANSDNVANLVDVLAVAVAYGQTGPVRPGANISWTPQWAQDWANNYPFTATNVKHGDCNGDGVINISDLGAIAANFGLTHPKGSPRHKTSGAPDLYFDVANIVAAPGKTVVVPINLGNATASLDGVYGLSASVIVDGATLSTPATLGTNTSWLGDNTNTLMFNKDLTNNTILWAYARTNHKNATGNGTIATLTFTIPNGTPVGSKIKLDMDDVLIIDNNGQPVAMAYNVLSSEMTIVPSGISATNNVLQAASVIPNPSYNNAQLHVQLAQKDKMQVQVADVTGKVVFTATETLQAGSHLITLPANTARGLYTIQLTTTTGAPYTLKWVKY